MEKIQVNRKYLPLFRPDPDVRYVIVTGGRGSGKSFAETLAINQSSYENPYNILFSRFSMTSAETSIIPEFTNKMELCGNACDFRTKSDTIRNLVSGSSIIFKGILQSRKNQQPLKSIPDVRLFVLDEAQELVSEDYFNTIDFSIRTTGAQNQIWMFMNPTDINHWIYRRFYRGMGVKSGFTGKVDDVRYIHTTYLENVANLDTTFLKAAEKMRLNNPQRYDNVFLGNWMEYSDGLIYPGWQQAVLDDTAAFWSGAWYGLDWGFTNDPTAIVRIIFYDGVVYLKQVCYTPGMQPDEIASIVRADQIKTGNMNALVYCDPARPEHIAELRRTYDINAVPANNRDKVGRISWMRGCKVAFEGADIENERCSYFFLPSPTDQDKFTNVPQDGGDHLMDAINYGTVTHLRRQAIPNSCGEL